MTYDERRLFLERLQKLEEKIAGELQGQWEHIRNLETKLLNPAEIPALNYTHAEKRAPVIKPNCY